MASDDKKIKTNSAPENEAPPEKKSTSGAEPSKADGGELALLWQIFCVHGIPKSLFL